MTLTNFYFQIEKTTYSFEFFTGLSAYVRKIIDHLSSHPKTYGNMNPFFEVCLCTKPVPIKTFDQY